ncbi:hypothetical protein M569_02649, partial [Genlisea aurea]
MAIGLADNQGLVGHLTGETPPPIKFEITGGEQTKTLSAAYIQWHSADRLLRSWLLGTISEESWPLVIGSSTTRDLWEALADAYAQKSEERKYVLRYQL